MCACVSVCRISSILSPLHTPVYEFPKAELYGPGDSMSYGSSGIKPAFFVTHGLYCLTAVTLKSNVLAKIKMIFKEVFA